MVLNRLRLHPFAGTRDREVAFGQGLNVVLGPNEAGKSTLFNALASVLLTTTDLTAAAFKAAMGRFMPAGGGDTIRVRLDFGSPGGWVEKSWSPGNRKGAVHLVTGEGAEYTDPAAADPILTSMFPASPASVRELLMTGQAEISPSGPSLDPGEQVRGEIGDLLRQAVMETGGVSVERFRALLDEQYARFFNNWDNTKERPAGGREADNPHRKNVGAILQHYYDMSRLEAQYREAVRLETEVDRINSRLRELGSSTALQEAQRNRLLPLRDPLRRRGESEAELRALRAEIAEAGKVNADWPVKEDRLRRLAEERASLEERIARLDSEKEAAEAAAGAQELRRHANELTRLKADADAAAERLSAIPPVGDDELRRHSSLCEKAARLRALLDASRLTYTVLPRTALSASALEGVSAATQKERKLTLEAGKEHRGEAAGRIVIDLPDATISVWAGGNEEAGALESAAQSLSKVETEAAELRARFGAADGEELDRHARAYANAAREMELLTAQFHKALGEEDYDELLTRAGNADASDGIGAAHGTGAARGSRPLETVITERAEAASAMERAAEEARRTGETLADYGSRFGSPRELFLKVASTTARIDEIERSLESLPRLPAGFDTADAFFGRIDELEETLRDARESLHGLQQERTLAEAAMPEESSEQLAAAAAQARAAFERTLSQGRAVETVRRRTAEILAELEEETFVPYRRRFTEYLARVSGGRFSEARLHEAVPESFASGQDGEELSFDLLSWGTRDLVALALRLVLAEYVLKDHAGFLVLDDPLVDMDPVRRQSSAGAIREFAARYQTVVFTCHPDHAAELGGNLIELKELS